MDMGYAEAVVFNVLLREARYLKDAKQSLSTYDRPQQGLFMAPEKKTILEVGKMDIAVGGGGAGKEGN